MVGAVQGLIGSLKTTAAPPPSPFKRCTTFLISIGCCTNVSECGIYGAGADCATQTNPGPNSETFCT
jgi:hypothetical protein